MDAGTGVESAGAPPWALVLCNEVTKGRRQARKGLKDGSLAQERPITRIAGALLRLHRAEHRLSGRDFADQAAVDESTVSRTENGRAQLHSFCDNIGAYAETLNLSTEDVAFLMNALWADVLFAAIGAAKADDAGRRTSRLRLLQTVSHNRDARRWLNALVFDDPPPLRETGESNAASRRKAKAWRGVPCLARDREVRWRFQAAAESAPDTAERRSGPKVPTMMDVLHESLFVRGGKARQNPLKELVRDAIPEAIEALQAQDGSKPRIGELLRVLAEVAKTDREDRAALVRGLRRLSAASLHAVDARYRSRALYLLGDDQALCEYAASCRRDGVPETVLEYYRKRIPGESEGIQAVSSLSRRVSAALAERSASLASFYLAVITALLASPAHASPEPAVPAPLANYYTSEELLRVARGTLELHRSKGWGLHSCASPASSCGDVAAALARTIVAAVNKARRRLGKAFAS